MKRALLFAILVAFPTRALAWSPYGHMVVAAYANTDPAAAIADARTLKSPTVEQAQAAHEAVWIEESFEDAKTHVRGSRTC